MAKHPSLSNLFSSLNPAVDWETRLNSRSRRVLNWAERISLWLETPLVRLLADPRFNPLYHTGTLTLFFLFVLLFTGLYLTMFYPFGFSLSYQAVSNIEANLVGRLIRALHRYAADAAVITALLHAWRTFFQDRFRGPRWLAWTTGIGMAFVVWIIGITGYWLIWDERAHVLTQSFFDLIQGWAVGKAFIVNYIAAVTPNTDWIFLLIVLILHLGLSALVGLFLWWHLKRMSRPKWLPPTWLSLITFGTLFLIAIIFPAGMLPPYDVNRLPGRLPLDLFYLAYLPAVLRWPALVWSLILLVTLLLALLPWLDRRKKLLPVQLDLARCIGCTLCARDCPYRAIQMIPRSDGAPPKYQAAIDPRLCVSCGVCVGSCPTNALSLHDHSTDALWHTTLNRVATHKPVRLIFTCERHAQLGARALIENPSDTETLIVPLTCVAMAHPNLVAQGIEAGVSEVQFVGCPPEDCANREGNLRMSERLLGQRMPKLKRTFLPRIRMDWLSPLDFRRADHRPEAVTAYRFSPTQQHLRPRAVLIATLLLGLAGMVRLSQWEASLGAHHAFLNIILHHRSGLPFKGLESTLDPEPASTAPTRLILTVNGVTLLDASYPMTGKGSTQAASIFEQFRLPAGSPHITLTLYDRTDPSLAQTLFDQTVVLEPYQVLNLKFDDQRLGGDPDQGKRIFYEATTGTNAGCRICHSLEPGVVIVGPSLAGIATHAATRVPGLSAEEYLRQSILQPNAYVVEGFPSNQMPQNYAEVLTEEQIEDLIAFLLTLK